jgi:hypothetical protein
VVAALAADPLLEQEGEDTTVTPVRPGASSRQCGGGQRGGSWRGKTKPGCGGGDSGGGKQVSHTLMHADQARMETGLGYFHFAYGAKAWQCRAPCTWWGN